MNDWSDMIMELKVSLEFDIDDYIERWSEDSLAKDIEESIKQEALAAYQPHRRANRWIM